MTLTEAPVLFLQDSQAPPTGAEPQDTTQTTGQEPTGGQAAKANPFAALLPFLIIGVIFWVLLIAPERKSRKKQEEMRASLKKGDEVMTTGGLFGKVVALDEERVTLQIADGVRVKYLRQAIQGRVGDEEEKGKGSGKS